MSSDPSINIRYIDTIESYYKALYQSHAEVDFVVGSYSLNIRLNIKDCI